MEAAARMTVTAQRLVRIFCKGQPVFARHVDGNRYRCERCGHNIRCVNVWGEASGSVRQFKQRTRR